MDMNPKSVLFDRAPSFSFEFFPPKTPNGAQELLQTIVTLQEFHPSFVSVTYGAGGGSRELTLSVVHDMQQRGIPTVPHLTCVGHTEQELDVILEGFVKAGARAILALRVVTRSTTLRSWCVSSAAGRRNVRSPTASPSGSPASWRDIPTHRTACARWIF